MGIGGSKSGGQPLAGQQAKLAALRVTSSSYGSTIPILYGTNRVGPKMIWYGDFVAIPHTSSTRVGGKGGGGAKAVSSTTYTYQAAVALALCEGPIKGLYNVWDTKGTLALVSTTETYTVPGGGGTFTPSQAAHLYDDYGVGRTDAYSVNATDYGDIPRTYAGTYKTKMVKSGGAPATGQYQRSGSNYVFAAGDAGKVMSVTYVYSVPDSTGTGIPASNLSLTLFLGARPQSPWGYLTTNHPGQDLGYTGIAYISSAAWDLGTSGSMPNYSYEVGGQLLYGAGIIDANPADIILDLLTSLIYGAAFPSGNIQALTSYSNYCIANGLFISPLLDAQKAVRDYIMEWLEATNSAVFWSEGLIKIVPYGDTTIVGNGVTYTPNTTPIYDLNDDDYLAPSGSGSASSSITPVGQPDPLIITRNSNADVYNAISHEFSNRANSYNIEIVEEKDQNSVEVIGIRSAPVKASHFITTLPVAQFAANTQLKRAVYIRKKYQFTLGWRYDLLEPMDLVTLTDSGLGLVKEPVRIIQIEEDELGNLNMTAEEFPWGTATSTAYPKQLGSGFAVQDASDPGPIGAMFLYEPPMRATQDGLGNEIWLGAYGTAATWGGASVYISEDNINFRAIGRITAPMRFGATSDTLAAGADPDVGSTLHVDLTASKGTLAAAAQTDADNFRTLFYLGKGSAGVEELLSYRDATLTSPNHYTVSYLRRGVYGSPNGIHTSGNFVRIDDAIFKYKYAPNDVGKTFYFKLTSFNNNGFREQSLGSVSSTSIVLGGYGSGADNIPDDAISEALVLEGTVTSAAADPYIYQTFAEMDYAVIAGDRLEYDIWVDPNSYHCVGQIDFLYGGVAVANQSWSTLNFKDQNGISYANSQSDLSGFAKGVWYHRVVDLTQLAGQTINKWIVDWRPNAAGAPIGSRGKVKVANIKIRNAGSTSLIVYANGAPTSNWTKFVNNVRVMPRGVYVDNFPSGIQNATGKNLLGNGGFEFNNVGAPEAVAGAVSLYTTGFSVADEWAIGLNNQQGQNSAALPTIFVAGLEYNSTVQHSGFRNLLARIPNSVTIPVTGGFSAFRIYSKRVACRAGDVVTLKGFVRWDQNTGALPAGVSGLVRLGLVFIDDQNNFILESNPPDLTSSSAWVAKNTQAVAPSGAQFVITQCSVFLNNASGGNFVVGSSSLYMDARWDDLVMSIQNTAFEIGATLNAYTASGGSPLSAAAPSVANQNTISIASANVQFPDGLLTYSSGSVSSLLDNTLYYVYADDPAFQGGAVTYVATTDPTLLTANNARVYFGHITTGHVGAGGTSPGGGAGNCFTGNTLIVTRDRGLVRFDELTIKDSVMTLAGWRRVIRILQHDYAGPMQAMPDEEYVTPAHKFWLNKIWTRAEEMFPKTLEFVGTVWNCHVEGTTDEENCYTLANGHVAHNYNKL